MSGFRAGSLFSGIEGFGLGLIWSGLISDISWQVEIDPYCRSVLEKWFPKADRSCVDVKNAKANSLSKVDLVFGGFPCQNVSASGDGSGLEGKQSGLWYEFARIIREIKPTIVLVENVASGKSKWLCAVRNELQSYGYRTSAVNIGVDDCGGGHRRKRIFVLAYTNGFRLERSSMFEPQNQANNEYDRDFESINAQLELASSLYGVPDQLARWPSRGERQHKWEPPRIQFNRRNKREQIKALGNAVSPIQAFWVGVWAMQTIADNQIRLPREFFLEDES